MISEAIRLIQVNLQRYILEFEPELGPDQIVIVDNIALAEELGGSNNISDHVVMSLVNVQEESTLKNAPPYRVSDSRTIYRNPPVHINLFILFSCLHQQYATSLRLLSRVIEFFQWQKEFSFSLTPVTGNTSREIQEIVIRPDLYSLTFEQLNHLWGALGGKQVPFVLYRMRVIALEAEKQRAEGNVITEVYINE
ncbi:MAG: DUF4255 domain-containing protein [Leptolyngbya sp. SIO3F4]|nr:DUF4255 domain-containing protein [Leptolyngbya sp. SIO3F4]